MSNTEEVGVRLSLKERRQFSQDADRARRDVKNIGDEAEKSGRKAKQASGGFLTLSKSLGGGLRAGVGIGVTALGVLGAAIGGLAVKTVGMAMNAAETGAAFGTVFKGIESDVVPVIEQLNRDFGIPTAELQAAATNFGVFGKAAGVAQKDLGGFTTDLTTAGLDLASFYNADPSEVFLALRSGLSGEAEPLRRFGIFLSDATMKAKALEMGIGGTNGELTESQKVMVRQAIIMQSLGDAQGDMARTSGGLANQWRGFKGRLTEAGTAIGTLMLPMATRLVSALNDRMAPALDFINSLQSDTWRGFVTNLDEAVGANGRVVGALDWTVAAFSRVKGAWGDLQSDTARGFFVNADEMLGLNGTLVASFDTIVQVGKDLMVLWRDGVGPVVTGVLDSLPGPLADIISPLQSVDELTGFLAEHAEELRPVIGLLTVAYLANKTASRGFAIQNALSNRSISPLRKAMGNLISLFTKERAAKIRSVAASAAHTAATVAGKVATAAWTGIQAIATAAQWAWNAAMAANPIVLVIIAIVALIAIVVLAYQKVGWFRDAVDATWQAIQVAWDWVTKFGNSLWQAAQYVWDLFLKFTPLGQVLDHLPEIFGAVRDAIGWVIEKGGDFIGWIMDLNAAVRDKLGDLFRPMLNGFKNALNAIIRLWNNLSFTTPGIDLPGSALDVQPYTFNTPNLPYLHAGGTVTSSGSAVIKPDEEVVLLPTGASVLPLPDQEPIDLERFRGGGGADDGGGDIILQVDGEVLAKVNKRAARKDLARR